MFVGSVVLLAFLKCPAMPCSGSYLLGSGNPNVPVSSFRSVLARSFDRSMFENLFESLQSDGRDGFGEFFGFDGFGGIDS